MCENSVERLKLILCFVADIRSKNREKVHLPTPRKDNKGGDSESKKVDCSGESGLTRTSQSVLEPHLLSTCA